MESIVDLIEKLEGYEEDSVNNFDEGMVVGSLLTTEGRKDAIKKIFRIEDHASPYDIENWGVYAQGMLVPWQLTTQSTLIVNLSPMSRDDFIKTYGLTPEQFATLAEKGFIIPNLYEYESDKKRGFIKHRTYGDVIRPILYNEFSRCRINTIRRNRFFDVLGVKKFEEHKREGLELFRNGLMSLNESTRGKLTHNEGIEESLITIANNWAYVVALGTSNRKIYEGIKRIRFRFNPKFSPPSPDIIRAEIDFVKACKNLVATPYTAAFGGATNMSVDSFNRFSRYFRNRRFVSRENIEEMHKIGETEQALMELLTNVGLRRYTIGTDVPDYDFPISMFSDYSMQEFNNFVSFLTDIRESLIGIENILDHIHNVSDEMNSKIQSWIDILKIHEEIRQQQKLLKMGHSISSAVVEGGAISLYAHALSNTKMRRRTFHVAMLGLGATGISLVSNEMSEILPFHLSENKVRVLDDFNKLKKWQEQ